jgi:hypothetical protein
MASSAKVEGAEQIGAERARVELEGRLYHQAPRSGPIVLQRPVSLRRPGSSELIDLHELEAPARLDPLCDFDRELGALGLAGR